MKQLLVKPWASLERHKCVGSEQDSKRSGWQHVGGIGLNLQIWQLTSMGIFLGVQSQRQCYWSTAITKSDFSVACLCNLRHMPFENLMSKTWICQRVVLASISTHNNQHHPKILPMWYNTAVQNREMNTICIIPATMTINSNNNNK